MTTRTTPPRRPAHPFARLAGPLVLGLLLGRAVLGAELTEYAVKAAYLTKFGLYVEWPASAFATAASPLTLCVVGEDPFGAMLDDAAGNQRVGGRPVAVRRLKAYAHDSGCHIVYLGIGEAARAGQVLDAVRGSAVLTVTDSRGPAGIVHFVIKDNRVRFDIDAEAAAQNGLTISSKLLSLAVNVKPRR